MIARSLKGLGFRIKTYKAMMEQWFQQQCRVFFTEKI
jgi:hypothetical protein